MHFSLPIRAPRSDKAAQYPESNGNIFYEVSGILSGDEFRSSLYFDELKSRGLCVLDVAENVQANEDECALQRAHRDETSQDAVFCALSCA